MSTTSVSNRFRRASPRALRVGIAILAGGLGTRLGRDKARLRLGRRTLVGHLRAAARGLGLPVRVIRRDRVPRCGPLGGVFTALKAGRADAQLFLACDMPFVPTAWLARLVRTFRKRPGPLFTATAGGAGFPFLLPRASLAVVERQIAARSFSLQELAREVNARLVRPPRVLAGAFFNVNTPADWAIARQRWQRAQSAGSRGKRKSGRAAASRRRLKRPLSIARRAAKVTP
jgi:molybdopterin-guanine dinucleotide biosynthesis protein A